MLDLVRQGLSQKGTDKDKVFLVRGRKVTLADALHYFNRKGIKDPASLLEKDPKIPARQESLSPEDFDVPTPTSGQGENFEYLSPATETNYDIHTPQDSLSRTSAWLNDIKQCDMATYRLNMLCDRLGFGKLEPLPPFRTLSVEASIRDDQPPDNEHARYLEAIFVQTQTHYRDIFTKREISLTNSTTGPWSATSDNALADQFYYLMYHGYSDLWNDQKRTAFENFHKAFGMIDQLLTESHVGFLIYVFDLVIRHDGTGFEEPLIMLLQQLAEMSERLFNDQEHPIYLIANWLINTPPEVSRAWLCLSTMRKLLDYFQDSIGYFHTETIALLHTFATALLNKKLYSEAAVRFQQLVDAFSITQGNHTYDVCYALRSASEALFHDKRYRESMQAIKMALDQSSGIPRLEEREIHVRCLRAMAELSNVTGEHQEALDTMQTVVDICATTYGPEHAFTKRARMHQKSLRKGGMESDGGMPPMVYRLGRGGDAARHLWTTGSSPTRLQA